MLCFSGRAGEASLKASFCNDGCLLDVLLFTLKTGAVLGADWPTWIFLMANHHMKQLLIFSDRINVPVTLIIYLFIRVLVLTLD